jgi:hypothetical protein
MSGGIAPAGIDVGDRVVTTQALPEGIAAGTPGTVVRSAGWIGRRWQVEFPDGRTVAVPEYALDPDPASPRHLRSV